MSYEFPSLNWLTLLYVSDLHVCGIYIVYYIQMLEQNAFYWHLVPGVSIIKWLNLYEFSSKGQTLVIVFHFREGPYWGNVTEFYSYTGNCPYQGDMSIRRGSTVVICSSCPEIKKSNVYCLSLKPLTSMFKLNFCLCRNEFSRETVYMKICFFYISLHYKLLCKSRQFSQDCHEEVSHEDLLCTGG